MRVHNLPGFMSSWYAESRSNREIPITFRCTQAAAPVLNSMPHTPAA